MPSLRTRFDYQTNNSVQPLDVRVDELEAEVSPGTIAAIEAQIDALSRTGTRAKLWFLTP